ncbi:hypothetical protein BGS_1283 [Beggiatoa sp. SS]|nr:hypothetical protein BGS_1283 [Beggiatoa sp. SS]
MFYLFPMLAGCYKNSENGQLIKGYGPAENPTFTCCCPLTENQIGLSIPIGRPIANTQVYIFRLLSSTCSYRCPRGITH